MPPFGRVPTDAQRELACAIFAEFARERGIRGELESCGLVLDDQLEATFGAERRRVRIQLTHRTVALVEE